MPDPIPNARECPNRARGRGARTEEEQGPEKCRGRTLGRAECRTFGMVYLRLQSRFATLSAGPDERNSGSIRRTSFLSSSIIRVSKPYDRSCAR